jgi:hypothetical protein
MQKELAVSIGEKDPLAGIASARQMINCAGELQPKRTCHAALVSSGLSYSKTRP